MKTRNKVLKNMYYYSHMPFEAFIDRCACVFFFFSLNYNNHRISNTL